MYREIAPPPDLAPWVACLWTSTARGGVILPDGCADLVWRGDRLVVAGPATGPALSAPAGASVFGVRFRLGVAGTALGLPATELRDANVAVDEIWGAGVEERVAVGGLAALLDEVRARRAEIDPLARTAALAMARPGARVDAVDLGVSERQLRRRFVDAVGYGPKTLARVLRFQRFLTLEGSLVERAFAAGYSDQAHLTREARRLSGRTPAELVASGAGPAGERVRFVQERVAPGAYRPA